MISPEQRPLPDNTQHSQETDMPPAGFEHAIPASERQQTHALERAASTNGQVPDWAGDVSTRLVLALKDVLCSFGD